MAFHLGPRLRSVLKYIGYVFLALITFVFALQLTFPYARVKDRIEEALSTKYDVTIEDYERGIIPGRLFLKSVMLRTRPAQADIDKIMSTVTDPKDRERQIALLVSTLYIERLEIDVGFMALVRGVASINIDAKIDTGHIAGNVALSKDGTNVHVRGNDLPAEKMPMRELVGLPMSGTLEFAFDLDLPNEQLKSNKIGANWQRAEGAIEFTCPSGCVFGDGKTKLKPKLKNKRNEAFAEGGIDFGTIHIENLVAQVEIKDKKLELTKFDAKSSDGEIHVDFALALQQEFGESATTGCLRFKGSDALLKREPKTHAAISTTGAQLGPDNLFHIKLDGKFKDMKRLAHPCGPNAGPDKDPNGNGNGNVSIPQRPPVLPEASHDAGVVPATPPGVTNIVVPRDVPPTAPDAAVTVPVPHPDPAHGSAGSGSAPAPEGTTDTTVSPGADTVR
ncbi:MAG: type II secretion system protein GspN [Deltaproteobacteria bacterium]|nr:type II secretion system protein GspN [Deltaproteobacteria bacterium]